MNDLRKELESRSLSSKGLKSQLIARLTKQLKVEEQVEEAKEPELPESQAPEEEAPQLMEEDREVQEVGALKTKKLTASVCTYRQKHQSWTEVCF